MLFLFQAIHNGVRVLFVTPGLRHFFKSAKLTCDGVASRAAEALESHSRYKDTPWVYLESEGTEKSYVFGNVMCIFFRINAFLFFLQNTLSAMDPDLFGQTTEGTIKAVYLLKRPGRLA